MSTFLSDRSIAVILLVLVFVGGLAVHLSVPIERQEGSDIYYNWIEGGNILAGQNPYARILSGDMRVNQKYPTYFPLIYYLSALTERWGLKDYQAWLSFWHIVTLTFTVGVGCVIYGLLYQRSGLLAAIFGALFWLLNRWTLHNSQAVTYDALPIFFMLVSLWLLPRHKLAALLMFSLSLALKHVGAILIPIYLVYVWQSIGTAGIASSQRVTFETRGLAVLGAGLALATIPVLVSLPFFVWPGMSLGMNAEAFLRSMVFQITRDAAQHVAAPSVDSLFGLWSAAARLPILLLLVLVYGLYGKRKVELFTACLLVMAVFIDFNSVLFLQYFSYMTPFIPLVIAEVRAGQASLSVLTPNAG
jgi:hypothetical protein